MNENFRKLTDLLTELFQLDAADLDFGIYRIMNQKRDEIVRFLEHDLLPQVRETLQASHDTDVDAVSAELRKLEETLTAAGVDPSTSPKVQELRAQMAQADITGLENEVFSHLTNFFRRYYSEGDFISLRRYKPGVYAIPYEGEEVKLHWANADQYYIKTSEYFRDYTFTLPSGKRAHFRLAEADTERDNNRTQNGNERRFILCTESPVSEENRELIIRFEYRQDEAKRKQADLNTDAVREIMAVEGFADWQRELATPTATGATAQRMLLEKQLTGYTMRNTFDYFIHKDLNGFLRRELDFFIKNDVVRLDDIEEEAAPRVEQYLAKVKALRRIGHKVIALLAQIE
jgi:adenine-specific DNA-methyltransferase